MSAMVVVRLLIGLLTTAFASSSSSEVYQQPGFGVVSITSEPAGAVVYVDGGVVGVTPTDDVRLAAGDHRVRLLKEGFLESVRSVRVTSGAVERIRVDLTRGGAPAARQSDLRIAVISGDGATNIIEQKRVAVPIVEVRDRSGSPAAGALVTFMIEGATATFGGGVPTLTVGTNAVGHAVASGFRPVARGSVRIGVQAAFQGQYGRTVITQTNLATASSSAAVAPVPAADLRIVVLEGEDAVNIIQQKTAVAPLIEVRDRNNLPVSGALVTFAIEGGAGASFGGASTLTIATNAAGQAAATGLSPVASGALQINVQAAFQGQLATATITQTNVMTAAQAAAASGATSASSSGAGSGGAGGGASAGGGMSKGLLIGLAGAGAGAAGLALASGSEPPPPPPCAFTVSPTSFNPIPGTGGTVTATISATPVGCSPATWTATSQASFVTVSPSSGTGDATVTITVSGNPTGAAARSWSVNVAGQVISGNQNQAFPPCNSQQVSGANTPETRTIEMGRTSGTFTFEWQMFSVQDRMVVSYEGRTLFDTGCVSGGGTRALTYSGGSSTVTVQVFPACAGGSTAWDFVVSCPR